MRRLLLSTALSALMLSAVPLAGARAQSDTRALYDRIERLERDLMTLQQLQARGGSTVVRSNDGSVAGTMAQRLDDRINELEELNRQLTGKIEEANFKAQQLNKQLERMQADIDLRFKDLEAARASGAQAPAAAPQQQSMSMPAAGATRPDGAPVLIPPKGVNLGGNSSDGTGPAPGPQNLGSMPAGALRKGEAEAANQAAKAAPKDPQAAYEEAYGLLQKGEYDAAEKGLQAFLKANPNHALAGNAQFWLGDIAFSQRKDFAASAKLFGEAYKKYPKHSKAPDMLYKLGASFGQLDMKDQACRTYALLFAEHPGMPDRIKRAATGDKQRLGCK